MYRRLRAIDADYPVAIQLGDVGHPIAQNPADQWQVMNDRANAFIEDVFAGAAANWSGRIFSFVTSCPDAPAALPFESADWDHLADGAVGFSHPASVSTVSAVGDPVDGVSSDPVVKLEEHAELAISSCITENDLPIPGWTWAVPGSGMTMAGLPDVRVAYSIIGTDATVIFKLWDVFDGKKTLVTRGVWRLTAASDPMPAGEIRTKLFGNAWRFAPGHSLKLEVSQTDVPSFRPDNLPSSITFTDARLEVPVRSP